jgi:hypothetical protein
VFEDVFNLKGETVEDLASEFSKWVKVRREEKQNKEKQNTVHKEPILREIEKLNSRKLSLVEVRHRVRQEQFKLSIGRNPLGVKVVS